MPILLPLLAAAAFATAPTPAAPASAQVLPTLYEAGHFYAVPQTANGERLKLLVDTGGGGSGGMYWISRAAARRLQLDPHSCAIGDQQIMVVRLPAYQPGRGVPPPLAGACGAAALTFDYPGHDFDGQLGAGYLPGRVWTFDYPARRLSVEGAQWHPDPAAHATPLGFPRNAGGQPASGMPRITIHVDGQPVDMLLDTGATAHPTAAGEKASSTPTAGGYGVTSYIATSMVERWHKAHPGWQIVEKGDDLRPAHPTRIIEVPTVEIAGWVVGPVWFTEQSDYAYHVYMASMMDKPVEGALGGNVFGHFVMTIDYPAAKAYFHCATGCKATR